MRAPLLLPTILAAAAVPLLAQDAPPPPAATPDFAGTIVTAKMGPVEGKRRVLAILWDPRRPNHPAPSVASIDSLLFGSRPSVADWFRENSGGKLELERAGVLGWYAADKPAGHYWTETKERDKDDTDGDGFLNGHAEKWTEAIRKAARDVRFSSFDTNGDHVLTPDELSILIVIPQAIPFGSVRTPAAREHPQWESLVVDGVQIPAATEWYTGLPPSLGTPAHELCHLLLASPDLYVDWPYRAGGYSLMDRCYATVHLDPFEKLKLGWIGWDAVREAGERELEAIETGRRVLVLFDPARGPGEYFLVENRWRGTSYDAGVAGGEKGIAAEGVAVWHIVEDPATFATALVPNVVAGDWGRRGIRLVRANGGLPIDDRYALLDRAGAVLADDSTPGRLRWHDGTPTGFRIELRTRPGPKVRLRIDLKKWM